MGTDKFSQARDAGLGWLTPVCWGAGSNADPASLGPLVSAINRVAPNLKIALFDDTTSEVLRKNLAKGRGWTLTEQFDLNDLAGRGEGGLAYFYEQQWQRFFQTVPARNRLTVDGRPVVFMWHGGYVRAAPRTSSTRSSTSCARRPGGTLASTSS